jgi:hypothetical protein
MFVEESEKLHSDEKLVYNDDEQSLFWKYEYIPWETYVYITAEETLSMGFKDLKKIKPSRITGFLQFVHHPVFQKLEKTMFRKLDLFSSSGEWEDTYSFRSFRNS